MTGMGATLSATFSTAFGASFQSFSLRGVLARFGGSAPAAAAAAPTRGYFRSMGTPRQPVRAVTEAPVATDAVAGLLAAGAAPVNESVGVPAPPQPLSAAERESVMGDLLTRSKRAIGHARSAVGGIRFGRLVGAHADRSYFDCCHLLDALVSETREYEVDLMLGELFVGRLDAVRTRLEEQRTELEAARVKPASVAPEPVAETTETAESVVLDVAPADAAGVDDVVGDGDSGPVDATGDAPEAGNKHTV